jgi:hypothetical protein
VDAAKETELPVTIVRDGKQMTLKVTPARRPTPQTQTPMRETTTQRQSSLRKIEEALAELRDANDGESLALYFARPGIVATNVRNVKLPENMSISVTKEGDAPAKVHIKRDDKEWNVTVDKINELPEDVRRHVEALLSKVMHPMLSEWSRATVGDPRRRMSRGPGVPGAAPPVAVPQPPQAPQPPQPPQGPQPYRSQFSTPELQAYRVVPRDRDLDQKLDLILRKLDTRETSVEALQEEVKRLRKELDELRSK